MSLANYTSEAGNITFPNLTLNNNLEFRNKPAGNSFISIGLSSSALGAFDKGDNTISIGNTAGEFGQGDNSISIGTGAGFLIQGDGSVAIGFNAGLNGQGDNSIAIGNQAGLVNLPENSITLNATGSFTLGQDASNALYIQPVRNVAGSSLLQYNNVNGEISYSSDISGDLSFNGNVDISGNLSLNCNLINDVSGINFCDGTYIGQGNSFDISTNEVLVLSGVQDVCGNYNGASIVSKDRVYQQLNSDPSWNAVNGYVGLAKDAYPSLTNVYGEKAISSWISNITNEPTPVARSRPHGIIWCPEKKLFVSVNVATFHKITTSPDGLNWTGRVLLDPSNVPLITRWDGRGITYSPELDLFVATAIGTGGGNPHPPARNIATSTDGITWKQLDQLFDRRYIGVVWVKELGLFVAVSSNADTTGQIATSPDGINWTQQTIPSGLGGYQSICWSAELGLLVAVRSGTLGIATSPDGINWTPQTTPNNGHFQIDWSPQLGLFVVCSVGTGEELPTPQPPINTKMMTSPDGINWTYRSTPNNFGYRGVVWCSNLNCFVAVGASGSVNQLLISFDGINWKEGTLPNSITNRCICYSNELGIIVVGQDATNFDFLTSSLQGRPPTSYNVFDSSFNNIDQDGNWTIKAKEIYGDNLLVNSNVDISGELLLFNTDLSGNITTSTATETAVINSTSPLSTTKFLKVKIGGADAWIPYFESAPDV